MGGDNYFNYWGALEASHVLPAGECVEKVEVVVGEDGVFIVLKMETTSWGDSAGGSGRGSKHGLSQKWSALCWYGPGFPFLAVLLTSTSVEFTDVSVLEW